MYSDRSLEIGEDSRQRAMKHSITLPLLGIMASLMRWQTDKYVSLTHVGPEMARLWQLFESTMPELTDETYRLEVADLLKTVDAAVNSHPQPRDLG